MNETKFLRLINTPDDLKKLQRNELPQLCSELRQFIIDELSHNPGHLASSLGVVELSVALHYVFNTPYDRIIWDVGHQAYAHKILTGRRDRFSTNRQFKGLCGFPTPKESEYDAFGTGHSSTSISAALGMSVAALLKNERDRQVVAVIGDGAMTGGLASEGLNNASMDKNNMLIILNDNNMAIDPLKGGFTQYLTDITTSKTYNNLRYKAYKFLKKKSLMDESSKKRVQRFNTSLKTLLSKQQNNIFEGLNLRYFGPVDGHDVEGLVRILSEIKNFSGPKVLHLVTVKGKGYKPAEDSVTIWHAPGEFNVQTGERKHPHLNKATPPLYQEVFGHTLLELARMNDKIVGITPAMPSGCSMNIMQKEMPERVFDVGIAEGHAVTFSAGLAKEGLIPYCNIYSSFMQRAYDNIIHDAALQNLHVVLCIDRAGIVGADGATHHGLLDLAYLRCIPNVTIAAPINEIELRNLLYTAQNAQGVFAIRYPRGRGVCPDWQQPFKELPVGKGQQLAEGDDMAILSIGAIGNTVIQALKMYYEEYGTQRKIAHYDMRYLKPIDSEILHQVGKKYAKIMTVEDGVISGGLGSAVLEFMADNGYTPRVKRLGVNDCFVEHGSTAELYNMLELDVPGITKHIKEFLTAE
ncbi:MAG: 1-deoxy-D-xylulose-5-phosphate synthase [Bacteroidetes bacterium]|uniref:1-deoxy-D-xylulose-5-phosphate synthase n=1 Tax=Candidatus Gallipaludibacter merdavium TaxID=2840839 RepID=A0A9D9HU21_9BACT|nr:1-deoxy-D-xylulose-5-phosphate synthase [Candidatus Gallipaludibacter merdavium]